MSVCNSVRSGMASNAWKLAFPALLAVSLGACVSTGKPSGESPADAYGRLMGEAESLVSSGSFDAALQTFKEAAQADPTQKEPWSRSAQVYFDTGNYGRAIASAEEVLQRDPEDAAANSVMTIGGLRIAVQSLNRLQETDAIADEAARSEAQQLATTLRSVLGSSALEPERPQRARRAPARSPSRPQAAERPAAPAAAPAESSSSDPFRHLRPKSGQ